MYSRATSGIPGVPPLLLPLSGDFAAQLRSWSIAAATVAASVSALMACQKACPGNHFPLRSLPCNRTPDKTHLVNWSEHSDSWLVKLFSLDWLEQKPAVSRPFVEWFGHPCSTANFNQKHLGMPAMFCFGCCVEVLAVIDFTNYSFPWYS